MFGRRRRRQLEAHVKVMTDALHFYATAENWKRRGIHPKGSPIKFDASPMVKDHGGRAREALARLRMSRMQSTVGLIERLRQRHQFRRAMRDMREGSKALGDAAGALLKRSVTVPAPFTPTPESRPTGEIA